MRRSRCPGQGIGFCRNSAIGLKHGHLPRCSCARPVQGTRRDLRAALGHLLVVLRANGAIAERTPGTTAVDEEVRRFDDHMDNVRGLALKTRGLYLRTVRRLKGIQNVFQSPDCSKARAAR